MNNNKNIKGFAVRLIIGLSVSFEGLADISDVPDLTEAQSNAAVAVEEIFTHLQTRIDDGETLNDDEQALYEGAREIVHTGNQVLNTLFGSELPTSNSLNLDAEGFAGVLQWVTHEEISAQGQIAGEALGAQSANIGARLDALRMGARGFQVAWHQQVYPNQYGQTVSGNAGADQQGAVPPGGAFLNGGIGSGDREPTDREDAFEFSTWSLTGGIDYRWNADLIVGIALGFIDSEVDFDSSKSIVEGDIETNTWLLTAFASYQWQTLYLDGSFTYGQTDYDLERRISYPSQNVLIAATNELALAGADGQSLHLNLQGGWVFSYQNWTYGPTFALDLVNTDIDGFTEHNAGEFNLTVQDQNLDSMASRFGGRVQLAMNQRWGVMVPQLDVEWVHEYDNDARTVGAKFADDVTNTYFNIITDEPDEDFFVATLSVSVVLQQGMQGYFSYKTPFALANVDSEFITAGMRWEF